MIAGGPARPLRPTRVPASGRAGIPAATTRPAYASAPTRAAVPTTSRLGRRPVRVESRLAPTSTRRLAPRTRARVRSARRPSWRTRSSAARSAGSRAARPRPRRRGGHGRPSGIVFGSVIMKKRKIRISGEVTSSHQKSQPVIGPTCQRAVIECPLTASRAMPAANVSQKPTAIASRRSRVRIAKPPTTMTHEGQRHPRRHRPPPEVERIRAELPEGEEAHDETEVRRVEDVSSVDADHVLREQRDRGGPGEDPRAVQAPPVAVLGPGHAQDEGHTVSGEQRARGPHDDVVAEEGDADLEHGARPERDEDLGDRQVEAERRLPEHLQRDDHRGEMKARVADRRQQNGVLPFPGSSATAGRPQQARSSDGHGTSRRDGRGVLRAGRESRPQRGFLW